MSVKVSAGQPVSGPEDSMGVNGEAASGMGVNGERLQGVRIRLLGPVAATVDGHAIDLGGPKERTVLAVFAANPASSSSADQMIDALWGEAPPSTAKKTLQTYVSHLRKAFSPSAARPHGGIDDVARATLLGDALRLFDATPLSGTAPSVLLTASSML